MFKFYYQFLCLASSAKSSKSHLVVGPGSVSRFTTIRQAKIDNVNYYRSAGLFILQFITTVSSHCLIYD